MQFGATLGHWLLAHWGALALAIGALSAALGVWLALAPAAALRLDRRLSVWVSADRLAEQLNRRRHSGRFFYRHHRAVGALLVLAGAVLLYTLLVQRTAGWDDAIAAAFGLSPLLAALSAQVLLVLVALAAGLALLLGPLLYLRPSLLRPLEAVADRWINTDAALAALNRPRDGPTRWVERHPRATGAALILIGLLIAVAGTAGP
ncbi:hypothetical protein HUS23_07400 [Ectothiorhodospiraceae bacterium 2226]|nr:hypothetical protein HUS23_07400 [Ectothiorhodospiraceae bacterium 2226]